MDSRATLVVQDSGLSFRLPSPLPYCEECQLQFETPLLRWLYHIDCESPKCGASLQESPQPIRFRHKTFNDVYDGRIECPVCSELVPRDCIENLHKKTLSHTRRVAALQEEELLSHVPWYSLGWYFGSPLIIPPPIVVDEESIDFPLSAVDLKNPFLVGENLQHEIEKNSTRTYSVRPADELPRLDEEKQEDIASHPKVESPAKGPYSVPEPKSSTFNPPPRNGLSLNDNSFLSIRGPAYHCTLCSKRCGAKANWLQHIRGSAHRQEAENFRLRSSQRNEQARVLPSAVSAPLMSTPTVSVGPVLNTPAENSFPYLRPPIQTPGDSTSALIPVLPYLQPPTQDSSAGTPVSREEPPQEQAVEPPQPSYLSNLPGVFSAALNTWQDTGLKSKRGRDPNPRFTTPAVRTALPSNLTPIVPYLRPPTPSSSAAATASQLVIPSPAIVPVMPYLRPPIQTPGESTAAPIPVLPYLQPPGQVQDDLAADTDIIQSVYKHESEDDIAPSGKIEPSGTAPIVPVNTPQIEREYIDCDAIDERTNSSRSSRRKRNRDEHVSIKRDRDENLSLCPILSDSSPSTNHASSFQPEEVNATYFFRSSAKPFRRRKKTDICSYLTEGSQSLEDSAFPPSLADPHLPSLATTTTSNLITMSLSDVQAELHFLLLKWAELCNYFSDEVLLRSSGAEVFENLEALHSKVKIASGPEIEQTAVRKTRIAIDVFYICVSLRLNSGVAGFEKTLSNIIGMMRHNGFCDNNDNEKIVALCRALLLLLTGVEDLCGDFGSGSKEELIVAELHSACAVADLLSMDSLCENLSILALNSECFSLESGGGETVKVPFLDWSLVERLVRIIAKPKLCSLVQNSLQTFVKGVSLSILAKLLWPEVPRGANDEELLSITVMFLSCFIPSTIVVEEGAATKYVPQWTSLSDNFDAKEVREAIATYVSNCNE